jgi:predicted small lipoprotein YifL
MSFGYFKSSLTATLLVVCACVAVTSCGQKGELYVPAKNGAKENLFERRNAKSQYIFGSTVPADTPAPAAVETQRSKSGRNL